MKHKPLLLTLAIFTLSTLAIAQEKGAWRALSKTAANVTGDVFFSDERVTLNFVTFPLAEIRQLTPSEAVIPFDSAAPGGAGHLYRLSVPADKKFLHKNTLCGGDETQWLATYVNGKELDLAFYSGSKMPVFTAEAMTDTTNLCGIYAYVR